MTSFNKGHQSTLSFPFTQSTMDNLGPTELVSPRVGNLHGFESNLTDEQYAAEIDDVERVRLDVSNRRWPGWWFEKNNVDPNLSPVIIQQLRLSESNPVGCANIVKMDHPFEIWDNVIAPWAKKAQVPWRIKPRHQGIPFVESVQRDAWAHMLISHALSMSFDVKYTLGVQRPFEYSEYGADIELFPCPTHPERPAGHGGFCGGALAAFNALFDPTPEQLRMAVTATKQFAMFRTFSAMHIASSNLFGWEIGVKSIDTFSIELAA